MALTYTYNTILTTQTDADSPVNQILMDALRENSVHNFEWIGKDYTPIDNHDHDDVNSKAISRKGTTWLAAWFDPEYSDNNATYQSKAYWRLHVPANITTVTMAYRMKITGAATVFGQFTLGGTAYGEAGTTSDGVYVWVSATPDISAKADSTVEVIFQMRTTLGNTGYCSGACIFWT